MTQKLQRHKDTRTLPNSTTHHLCRAQEAQTHTTSGAAHAIDQKSRQGANEEKVHQTEMLKDPLIIVRGEELVAPDPTACDHHPAAWSGPAPADRNRTHPGVVDVRGRSDFSRFDPRPERPHFSNFGPPAERRPFFCGAKTSFCEMPHLRSDFSRFDPASPGDGPTLATLVRPRRRL